MGGMGDAAHAEDVSAGKEKPGACRVMCGVEVELDESRRR